MRLLPVIPLSCERRQQPRGQRDAEQRHQKRCRDSAEKSPLLLDRGPGGGGGVIHTARVVPQSPDFYERFSDAQAKRRLSSSGGERVRSLRTTRAAWPAHERDARLTL